MDKMAWKIPGKRIKAVKKSQPTTIAAGMAARLWQISTPYHGTAPRKKKKENLSATPPTLPGSVALSSFVSFFGGRTCVV